MPAGRGLGLVPPPHDQRHEAGQQRKLHLSSHPGPDATVCVTHCQSIPCPRSPRPKPRAPASVAAGARAAGGRRHRAGSASRSFYDLSVSDVTQRAGDRGARSSIGTSTISRDLLLRAATEAIEACEAQVELDAERQEGDLEAVRAAVEPAVRVYQRHGPVLRAVTEAGASNPEVAARGAELRRRFNELATDSLGKLPGLRENPPADVAESARALNLLNEAYLRDAFGHEPRLSAEAAIQTLTEIWAAFLDRRPAPPKSPDAR